MSSLALILAWDATGLDLWLAGLSATTGGFPWRDHALLRAVMHDGARLLVLLLVVALAWGVVRPWGPLRSLSGGRRLWLLVAVTTAMLLVSTLKQFSAVPCPWSLEAFGGNRAYVHHWDASAYASPATGRCFPAGHASAGFAWIAGFFAWPAGSRTARRWLAAALAAGAVLGIAQQLRGAHFMSHTLWTGWLCWIWAWAMSWMLTPQPDAHPAG